MMNKQKVVAIIVVMVMVLACLIGIQVYWIRDAIALREQQFAQNVYQALNIAARRMEQKDMMAFFTSGGFLSDNIQDNDPGMKFMNDPSCFPGFEKNKIEETLNQMAQSGIIDSDKLQAAVLGPQMLIDIDTSITCDSTGGTVYSSTIQVAISDSTHNERITTKSRETLNQQIDQRMAKMEYRKNLMDDVMYQMLFNDRDLRERLDRQALETFINEELENRNVGIPYEYAVFNSLGKPIAKSGEFQQADIKDAHRVTLFPNEFFAEPNLLLVHFPNQNEFIFRSLGVMSVSSMALLLVISLCFAYTIYIIYRQKKLSDMKTDFINNMTHELKTPVATISLASEMLKNERIISDRDKLSRFANVIHDENKRLGGQVEKVLQMATIDTGQFKLNYEEVDVHAIIANECDKLSLQIEERQGKFHLRLNAANPLIKADEVHLTNVITNLLDNAIKYSKDAPDITIETRNAANGIVVSVTDKGIGMNREQQKWVFERFYRVPTGNIHNVKGFGLGLSYVKTMTEAHGGSIKLKSELNKGSTFEIFIPYTNDTKNGHQH